MVVNHLVETLFEAETRRLNKTIRTLNDLNKELKGVKVDGFRHGGNIHLPVDGTVIRPSAKQPYPSLHQSLMGRMEKWLKDRETVLTDRSLIRQILFLLIKTRYDKQEIRDALPECLVPLVPGCSLLPRTREPGWTLQHKPMALRQFHDLTPKMEVYSAARLFY